MNKMQKEKVRQMRETGSSYAKISSTLGLSENTIKSYCKRNYLGSDFKLLASELIPTHCIDCGQPIKQNSGQRIRKYCSDVCRMKWWNKHTASPNRKNTRAFTCKACGGQFEAYGKRERKYCSLSCYGRSRAGQS